MFSAGSTVLAPFDRVEFRHERFAATQFGWETHIMCRNRLLRRCRCLAALIAATALALGGCGSNPQYQFDEFDLVPVQEELTEFSLGKYAVPIPVMAKGNGKALARHNRIQFDFELIAVVKRDYESQIADSWERHRGKIRDQVIRVCRNSSLDDLEELKAHLMDALQAQLGDKEIRQLVIAEVKSKAI